MYCITLNKKLDTKKNETLTCRRCRRLDEQEQPGIPSMGLKIKER
jgi:hypothetical protein